ncbi:MAG: hypothetical protein KJN63_05805, partial [Acidimicrobiia bacterium]|nr:hypothetical protein [Acidimicrobiia bacterium]
MARRIEVELTSTKDADTWTWRAAGARQPKGEVATSLLYPDAKVGDVCKVEAEFHLDGIEVLEVFAPKAKKERTDVLELISRPVRDDELVTEVKAPKGRGRAGDRDRGRPRRDRSERSERGAKKSRPPRGDKPSSPAKPRPTRLKPRRVHRDAVVAGTPEEHRPIAEQLLKGGLPAVRTAVKDDPNAKAIIAIAEGLQPKLSTAEWRDRAEAALADIDKLDLRDLRQVVVAADKGARDDETRAMAAELRESLSRRVESDHAEWLSDLQLAVREERTIRALRLTSRPVKAGSPIPVEIAEPLAAQTVAALGAETFPDRWASVVDALAFSPIRSAVTPAHYPDNLDEHSLDVIRAVSDRVPEIAAHYGIKSSEAKAAAKRVRAARKAGGARGRSGRQPRKEGSGEAKERQGGRDKRERRDRDTGPKVDRGPADLLRTPARPRPGTVIDEPEPEPDVAVDEAVGETAPAEAPET